MWLLETPTPNEECDYQLPPLTPIFEPLAPKAEHDYQQRPLTPVVKPFAPKEEHDDYLPPLPPIFELDETPNNAPETQKDAKRQTPSEELECKDDATTAATTCQQAASGQSRQSATSYIPSLTLSLILLLRFAVVVWITVMAYNASLARLPGELETAIEPVIELPVPAILSTPVSDDERPSWRDQLDCMLGWGDMKCKRD